MKGQAEHDEDADMGAGDYGGAGRRGAGAGVIELALLLKPLLAAKAKENQKAGGQSAEVGRQKSAEPLRAREELAAIAGAEHA